MTSLRVNLCLKREKFLHTQIPREGVETNGSSLFAFWVRSPAAAKSLVTVSGISNNIKNKKTK